MRHFSRALNSQVSKYRKRKRISLDGSLPGLPRPIYGNSRRHVSGVSYVPGRSSHQHNLYMGTTPRSYHPSLNAPAVQETEYESYEPAGIPHASSFFRPHRTSHHGSTHMPGGVTMPEDDMALIEQLRMVKGEVEAPVNAVDFDEAGPSLDDSVDRFPSFAEVADTLEQLSKVLPPDHQDLINLRMVAHEWLGLLDAQSHGDASPAPSTLDETSDPVVPVDDSCEMTQEMFVQAMEEVAMAEAEHAIMNEAIDAVEAVAPDPQAEAMPDLEEIIHEAMPDEDPCHPQQHMYDEMMEMMHPYMMHGPPGMAPIGPGIGPGPMPGP